MTATVNAGSGWGDWGYGTCDNCDRCDGNCCISAAGVSGNRGALAAGPGAGAMAGGTDGIVKERVSSPLWESCAFAGRLELEPAAEMAGQLLSIGAAHWHGSGKRGNRQDTNSPSGGPDRSLATMAGSSCFGCEQGVRVCETGGCNISHGFPLRLLTPDRSSPKQLSHRSPQMNRPSAQALFAVLLISAPVARLARERSGTTVRIGSRKCFATAAVHRATTIPKANVMVMADSTRTTTARTNRRMW